ncbi:hypothetical protein [Gorillibacterium sp. sgz5001074]|uniref:hypothetical protein n=1 Tax=Gorillibacterium sp. sgz5001074 TaxID=3446695 RepID=UPI003F67A280
MSIIRKLLSRLLHEKTSRHVGSPPYHPHASSNDYPKRPMGHGSHNQYGHSYYKKKKSSSYYSS